MSETSRGDTEQTAAFSGGEIVESGGDGFPIRDDLRNSILGQYRLEQIVGRGTMGRVYQASHIALHRDCAIKVLNPGLLNRDSSMLDQFWSEARVAAGLVHPNIVTIHNLGSDRGYHFIEMEYVPGGGTLKDLLSNETRLSPIRAAKTVLEVVEALAAAHRAGLVHRDVKPSNVLITRTGLAKLADFGLVCRRADLRAECAAVAGTPMFMAPELFEGMPAAPASDIYSVGVMLFNLVTGRPPFNSSAITTLIRQHQSEPVPDPREIVEESIPDELANLISRCLSKDPRERPDSAEHLSSRLRTLIAGLTDTETLVRESVAGLDCFIQGAFDQFRIVFPLPGDRLQEVYLEVLDGRHGDRLLTVFSVCCPAEPRNYEFVLNLNNELTYGSLSIREVAGRPMFVMTRTYPHGHADSIEIRAALLEIARRSDWVEQQLTRSDIY